MMNARDYETLGEAPLRNLSDSQGNQYLCYKPILKSSSSQPTQEACILLDVWFADQYRGINGRRYNQKIFVRNKKTWTVARFT